MSCRFYQKLFSSAFCFLLLSFCIRRLGAEEWQSIYNSNKKLNILIYFSQTSSAQLNGSDTTICIDSDNDDEPLNKTTNSVLPFDDIHGACSSKATSVIRMASQATSIDTIAALKTSTANAKIPYNRPPKKIVVKLKKPFVPVIEEEANLHPPENRTNSTATSFNTNVSVESAGAKHANKYMGVSENQSLLPECSSDDPHSPIRQSYTPQLPFNQSPDVDEQNEATSNELFETKYVPSCSYKLNTGASSSSSMCFNDNAEHECNEPCLDHKNDVIVFEISIEDSKDLHNVEHDALWEVNKENKWQIENKSANDLIIPGTSSCDTASTSSSFMSKPRKSDTNSAQDNLPNSACSSGISYLLPTFHRNDGDYAVTGDSHHSHLEGDASTSNPNFTSKYKYNSLELDKKTSYMNIGKCKNTSCSTERAPSTDSLNIITDEKMPAKGEISEQESNGDIESSWSHQVSVLYLYSVFIQNRNITIINDSLSLQRIGNLFFSRAFFLLINVMIFLQLFLDNENLPRYTSSYDTTVARESWSLSNEQNLPHEMDQMSTILSNL